MNGFLDDILRDTNGSVSPISLGYPIRAKRECDPLSTDKNDNEREISGEIMLFSLSYHSDDRSWLAARSYSLTHTSSQRA